MSEGAFIVVTLPVYQIQVGQWLVRDKHHILLTPVSVDLQTLINTGQNYYKEKHLDGKNGER